MKKGDTMNKQGFTIIEVALVLAIAGLIFLMMMIALPALQRQQRDTARKEDIESLIANIKKYQENNRGALPTNDTNTSTNWNHFVSVYMKDGFEDPSSGKVYNLEIYNCSNSGATDSNCTGEAKTALDNVITKSFADNDFKMYVIVGAKCAGDESKGAVKTSNPRKYSVLYKLEGGGLFCADA